MKVCFIRQINKNFIIISSIYGKYVHMNNNDILKIISEEINKFDFLSNDEYLKEQEVTDLLQNEELQKQFICDALLRRKDKVRVLTVADSSITGDWDDRPEDANEVSLEYVLDMEYLYDLEQEPIKFILQFVGDKIGISVGGWSDPGRFGGTTDTDYAPEGESWYDVFDWGGINVEVFTMEGDEIDFKAFNNAPPKIQVLFIREFTQNYIESETLELRTDELKDNIQNTPYC